MENNAANANEIPELPLWWKRLLGILIDLFIIYLIMSVETLVNSTDYLSSLFIVTIFVYFFCSELIFQTTIGKSIFGLKVFSIKNGKKANVWQIFIRTAMRYFPLDFVSYFLKRPRGMKDEVAKTVVIHKSYFQNA